MRRIGRFILRSFAFVAFVTALFLDSFRTENHEDADYEV